MTAVKKSIKQAQSEMKANMAVFDSAGDSLSKLESQYNGLKKVMSINEKQLKDMQKAYKDEVKASGESSKKAIALAGDINKLVTEQAKYEKQLRTTGNKLEDAKDGTEDLRSAISLLASENRSMVSSLQAQGKEVDALKADYDGLEKTIAKRNQLIDKERQKLQTLKTKYGENSEEVRKQIVKLRDLETAQHEARRTQDKLTQSIKNASQESSAFRNNLSKLNSKLKDTGAKLTVALSAPLTAIGTLGSSFSNAMDNVETRLSSMVNGSKKSLKDLKETIDNVYGSGVSSDTEELANTASRVKQRGIAPEDEEKAIEYATVLSKNSGQEAKGIVDVLAMLQNKFGMNIEQAGDYAQRIIQSGIEDMDQAMEYIPQLRDGGLSINEIIARLEGGMKTGAWNSDKSLDLLAEGQKRVITEKPDAYSGFGLGEAYDGFIAGDIDYSQFLKEAKKAADSLPKEEKKEFWATLFGTQGEDIDLGSIDGIFNADLKSGKASKGSADDLVNAEKEKSITRLTASFNKLKQTLQPVGTELMNMGADLGEHLIPYAQKASDWFLNLSDGGKKVVVGFGLAAAAMGPLMFGLKLVLSPFKLLSKAFSLFRKDGASTVSTFTKMKNGLSSVGGFLKTFATGGINLARNQLKMLNIGMKLTANSLKTFATGGIKLAGSAIRLLGSGIDKTGTVLRSIATGGIRIATSAFKLLGGGVGKAFKILKVLAPFLRVGLGTALRVLTGPIGWIITGISLLTLGFKYAYKHSEKFRNFVDKLKVGILGAWGVLKKLGVKGTVKAMWDFVKAKFSNGYQAVRDKVTSIKNRVSDTFTTMKTLVTGKIEDLIKKVKDMPGKMADAITNGKSALKKGAKSLLNGMIEGVEWGLNKVAGGIDWVLGKVGAEKYKIGNVPLGKYAKGTNAHPGGLAMVNDAKGSNYRELVVTPDGRSFVPKERNVVLPLPKGSQVLDGNKTAQLAKQRKIPKYVYGIGDLWKGAGKLGASAFNKTKDWSVDIWDWMKDKASVKKLLMNKIGSVIPERFTGGIKGGMLKGMMNTLVSHASGWLFDKGEEGGISGMAPNIGANAKMWAGEIKRAAARMKVDLSGMELNGIIAQIARESGGNQKIIQSSAVNDINMRNNNPARGLLQYIPQTFAAYRMKGAGDIMNGYHQLLAFFNNSNWRRDLPYGKSGWGPSGTRRFANGGIITRRIDNATISEDGPEAIIPLSKAKRGRALELLSSVMGMLMGDTPKTGNSNIASSDIISKLSQQNDLLQQQISLLTSILAKDNSLYLDGKEIYNTTERHKNSKTKIRNIAKGVTGLT